MASPMRPSTGMSSPWSPATAHSRRHPARALSRIAACSGSRLRPSRAAANPRPRNSFTMVVIGASGSATRSMNVSTACRTAQLRVPVYEMSSSGE